MESFWGFSNSVHGDNKKDGKKSTEDTVLCHPAPGPVPAAEIFIRGVYLEYM